MKALAEKLSSKDTLTRSRQGTNHNYALVEKSVSASPGSILLIQRKSLCPCDGGCPRCTGMIQPKLTISQPKDKYEEEADRIADQIMRMPDRGCPECMEEGPEVEELIQMKSSIQIAPPVTAGLQSQIESLRGGGQPLSQSVRTFFELRFGRDFSTIRVHTGEKAADAAKAVNAKAFTTGNDMVFGRGQFSPETSLGRRLIAHEIVHVIQQKSHNGRTLMRTCDCSTIGRNPTPEEHERLRTLHFPNLVFGDYCIKEPPPNPNFSEYNCFAYSVGLTDRILERNIDRYYGNYDERLRANDFDNLYASYGFTRTRDHSRAEIVLYLINNELPSHAAKISSFSCNGNTMYESKLGEAFIIVHYMDQLTGPAYGRPERFYFRANGPTMIWPRSRTVRSVRRR